MLSFFSLNNRYALILGCTVGVLVTVSGIVVSQTLGRGDNAPKTWQGVGIALAVVGSLISLVFERLIRRSSSSSSRGSSAERSTPHRAAAQLSNPITTFGQPRSHPPNFQLVIGGLGGQNGGPHHEGNSKDAHSPAHDDPAHHAGSKESSHATVAPKAWAEKQAEKHHIPTFRLPPKSWSDAMSVFAGATDTAGFLASIAALAAFAHSIKGKEHPFGRATNPRAELIAIAAQHRADHEQQGKWTTEVAAAFGALLKETPTETAPTVVSEAPAPAASPDPTGTVF